MPRSSEKDEPEPGENHGEPETVEEPESELLDREAELIYVYDSDGNLIGENIYGNCGFDSEGFYGCDYEDVDWARWCTFTEEGYYGCLIDADYAPEFIDEECFFNEEGDVECLFDPRPYYDWCDYDEEGNYSCLFPENVGDWFSRES